MKVIYKSTWYKACSVIRYLLVRLYYFRKMQGNWLSMIGSRCGIYIFKNGRITCAGRIIISDQVMLYARGHLSVGAGLNINKHSRIVARERIEIGDHVVIGQFVSILDHDHNYTFDGQSLSLSGYTTAPVKIGNNVWLADKCTVLKGVTIGDNVIAGAHTLINKDVPPNSVIGGVPFKILKSLTADPVQNLENPAS